MIIFLDSRYFEMIKNIDKENIKSIIWNDNLEIDYINFEGWSEWLINSIVEKINNEIKWKVLIEWNVASIYSKKIKKWV